MQIILLERVEKLGRMGDIVTVKDGFARNFLLPARKALRATESNKKHFEAQRAVIEAESLKKKAEAETLSGKLDGAALVLLRQAGDSGQLYGSVSSRDIAEALAESGFHIARTQIVLDKPIKDLGLHAVRVRLHAEVTVNVTVNVARSAEEAEAQVVKGGAVKPSDLFETEELAASALAEETEASEDASDTETSAGA